MKNSTKRIHISKRVNPKIWEVILNKILTIICGFLTCALLCEIFSSGSFFEFLEDVFVKAFSSEKKTLILFEEIALLLGISLALLPAFKMKYWNLGVEGQVVMGAFAAATVSKFIGPNVSEPICVILMIVCAILAGGIWSLIPALFKAQFGTNETLFTLMFNYIAMGIVEFFIQCWDPLHGLMNNLTHGMFPLINGKNYVINIFVVAVLFILMVIYINKSKHGYELSVVGENVNTARYIGINVKKVIIRSAFLSGAIAGLIGLLIVGYGKSCASTIAGGRGFTGVLIVWLGHFNPGEIALSSFLVGFLSKGAATAETMLDLGSSFPSVCLGVFFFVTLVGEFFINYKIVINKKEEKE